MSMQLEIPIQFACFKRKFHISTNKPFVHWTYIGLQWVTWTEQ